MSRRKLEETGKGTTADEKGSLRDRSWKRRGLYGDMEGYGKGMRTRGVQRMEETNGEKKRSSTLQIKSPHVGSGKK